MIDIAVIGVGNRSRKYLQCLPEGVRVAYLVEPEPLRLEQAASRYGVPSSCCFSNADDFFAASPSVGAVIIAAPDRLHVPLALRSVRRGWHVLLEKPVAGCEKDYLELMDASAKAGVHVGVCLEMRFHPYFRRIKEIYDSGVLGRVLSIDHTEHVGPDRMAHTFVRGLWSRVQDSGPIFLSKCCHDADFILWLTGLAPVEVTSRGAVSRFRFDGSAPGRCIDCKRTDCPYSAVSLYLERGEWTDGFDVPAGYTLTDVIKEELRHGRYGRCVYHCDNNVYDTQDVSVQLSGGVELSMHLDGTSLLEGRSTIIRGTLATLTADGGIITVTSSGTITPSGTVTQSVISSAAEKSPCSSTPSVISSAVEKSPSPSVISSASSSVISSAAEKSPSSSVISSAVEKSPSVEDYTALSGLPLHAGADRAIVEDFFASIASGRAPSASLESAFQAHRLCWLAG